MRLDYPWILAQESRCLLARASFAAEIPQIDESRLLKGKGMQEERLPQMGRQACLAVASADE